MKRSWIYFYAILFSSLFGLIYFSLFSFVGQDTPDQVNASTSDKQQVTLYVNQLGIYKNASNMYQNVSKLTKEGVDVLAYQKDELTYFVAHITMKEEEARAGIEALKALGFPAITKQYVIQDKQMIEQLKAGNYETVLSSIEATATLSSGH